MGLDREHRRKKVEKWMVLVLAGMLLTGGCGSKREESKVSDIKESPGAEAVTEPADSSEPEEAAEPEDTSFDFTLAFAGDMNLDENWSTTQY